MVLEQIQSKMDKKTDFLERTEILYGVERIKRLAQSRVLVVGVGGVGAYAAEMLCRAGVGHLTLIDADNISKSNINRQLPALHSTIGQPKVEILAKRFEDISPAIEIETVNSFMTPDTVETLLGENHFSFIVDAIDTVAPKIALVSYAIKHRLNIISSMGAGAKTDITKIQFADVWDTYHCGLSKAVRSGLKSQGLRGRKLPVVFCSQQADREALIAVEGERNKKTTAGTVSYMPATFGCFMAQYVLERL